MARLFIAAAASTLVLIAACSSEPSTPPPTVLSDGGATSDALVRDASSDLDAAAETDAAERNDAFEFIDSSAADSGESEDAAPGADHADAAPSFDPFIVQSDESLGLTNTSTSLDRVLEHGTLAGACAAYDADRTNRRNMLLCGKQMFFYEGFGSFGVPQGLFEFFIAQFPAEVGPGFERMGMIADPTSMTQLPLGVGVGAPLGSVPTLAFTCAACHFARLPDGRYAVGAANHAYEYGKQMLAVSLVPRAVMSSFDAAEHNARAIAAVQPMLDRLAADRALRVRMLLELLPLLGASASAPVFTSTVERYYASWPSGTMDFLITPAPIDDEVHTVSKITSLFGVPREGEERAAGMPHALLAWTGNVDSLLSFMRGFVSFGGGQVDAWPDDRLRPLVEYIYTLRTPTPPAPADQTAVAAGATLFQTHCMSCHDGPRGSGKRVFTFAEIGTDNAMSAWGAPDGNGQLCCGLGTAPASRGIKSPRLVSLWAMGRFLHNGAVARLEDVLCVAGPRGSNTSAALGDGGHSFGCSLSATDKTQLLAYLRAH